MKKLIFSAAVLLIALASCQKNNAPEVSSSAIPMTLTATIGGEDTKVSYVDEDNVLKTEWSQYDKVSVLSLDISGNVLTNDIFTATEAGNTAVFDGTFSNHPSTVSVWVYYPALTEGEGTEEKPWQVPAANSYDDFGVISDVKTNHDYSSTMDVTSFTQLQKESNKFSNLENYMLMSGQADLGKLAESELDVRLYHRSYVVKMDITLPKEGLKLHSLRVWAYSSDGSYGIPLGGSSWANISEPESYPGGWDTDWFICFGDDVQYGRGTGIQLDGDSFTAYVVSLGGKSWNYHVQETRQYRLSEGDYLTFKAEVSEDEELYDCILARKDITKTTILENGMMYRLSATLEPAPDPED